MEQKSYFHRPLQEPLEHRTLSQLLSLRAEEHPEREAIVLYDEARLRHSMTFREYKTKFQALAAALVEKGLRRGDRVCLMSPNNLEIAVSFMALNSLGANAILLPQGLASDHLVDAMTQLNCAGLVCYLDDDEEKRKPSVDAVLKLLKCSLSDTTSPLLKVVVAIGAREKWALSTGCIHSFDDLLHHGGSLDLVMLQEQQKKVQFDDPAMAICTSGSTGGLKACQFTNQASVLASKIVASAFLVKVDEHYRIFNDLPFSWAPGTCVGLAIPALGVTSINIPSVFTVRDRLTDFPLSVLSKEQCCGANLLPYLLYDIVTSKSLLEENDLGCLRVSMTGGQCIPEELTRNTLKLLPNLKVGVVYGSTETLCMVLHQMFERDSLNSETYGWLDVDPGVEVKVVDDEGCVLPVGSPGEICVRGPMIFQEYISNPELTSRTISRTGWYHTSDMGVMDDKGRVKIFGRKGDAINRGTDTFYPAWFERILAEHPLVAKNVMIGVPDKRLYEEVCACVILTDDVDREAKKAELEKWYDQEWPPNADGLSWKPGYTIFMEKFPLTRSAKPDRLALKKIAIKQLGLNCED